MMILKYEYELKSQKVLNGLHLCHECSHESKWDNKTDENDLFENDKK